jgi:rubrerythrin
MPLEKAIKTAIELEIKVKNIYVEAEKKAANKIGKRVFKILADEEMSHIAYLKHRLAEWKKSGKITVEKLDTVIPPKRVIEREVAKLQHDMKGDDHGEELLMLQKALAAEVETSEFYKRMVATLEAEGRRMFERFVEIEVGHTLIVQTEIDKLTGLGFWFDIPEFDLQAG